MSSPELPSARAMPTIEVSWGELIDKITILEIKEQRLTSPAAVANVRKELAALVRALAGLGVTTAAVSEMCRIGFSELQLASIWAMVLTPNAASARILEKVGFRPAGKLRQVERVDEEQVDRLYFDLLPGERRAVPSSP